MNQKMLDEKFDREQTSSNIAEHDFGLLFSFFINFLSSQMHSTFRHRKLTVLDEMLYAFALALKAHSKVCHNF